MNYKFLATFGLVVCMHTSVKADLSKVTEKSEATASNLKIGYVDVAHIFDNLPEAKKNTADFEVFQKQLEHQTQAKAKEFQEKYAVLQEQAHMLTEDQKKQKVSELNKLEKAFKELQEQQYIKIQEKHKMLIQPLYNKMQEVVTKIAAEHKYTFVFNKNAETSPILFFGDASFDLSGLVLEQLKAMAPKEAEVPVIGSKPQPSAKKAAVRGNKNKSGKKQ